jgi:hypothetical protein
MRSVKILKIPLFFFFLGEQKEKKIQGFRWLLGFNGIRKNTNA